MPYPLRITSQLSVTPLLEIQRPPFAHLYRDGVYWSLFKDRSGRPLSDRYFLANVRASLQATDVDGLQGYWLPTIGFHLGRLHGAILSRQTGKPRPDVTALACPLDANARRGYDVGRHWHFIDALIEQPDNRTFTDVGLIKRLQEMEREVLHFHEQDSTWYHAIGCILGELSGHLFPATGEEYARWEAEDRRVLAEVQARCQHRQNDLVPDLVQEVS